MSNVSRLCVAGVALLIASTGNVTGSALERRN